MTLESSVVIFQALESLDLRKEKWTFLNREFTVLFLINALKLLNLNKIWGPIVQFITDKKNLPKCRSPRFFQSYRNICFFIFTSLKNAKLKKKRDKIRTCYQILPSMLPDTSFFSMDVIPLSFNSSVENETSM